MNRDLSKAPAARPPPWPGIAAFALAYFGCAHISYDLTSTPDSPLSFWLPSGLFLGVLLIVERRHWLLLVLAAGVGDLCYNFPGNSWPLQYLLFAHLGNSLAAVAGAWLVRRWVADRPALSSWRELVGLVVLGGLVGLPLSATVGALLLRVLHGPASYWSYWTSWYCSDLLGVLLLTPALLAWRTATFRPVVWRFTAREFEATALLTGLIATLGLAYYFHWPQQTETLYLAFPFVIWASLRFGLRGATGVILITALLAAWFTARGFGLIGSSRLSPLQKIVEILLSQGVFVLVGLLPAIVFAAQQKAEATLREKDRVYRDLIENINQCYYVADRRSRFIYCNPALYAMGEYSRDDLAGISCFQLVAEEDRARVIQAYRQWARDPAVTEVTCEFRAATRSGRRFWVEQVTHFLRDHAGRVIEGRNVLRDITERRQAESHNRELADYLNKAHDGILVIDLHNRMIYCNRRAEHLTGSSAAELIGRTPENLTEPALAGQIQTALAAVQETGAWQGEFQLTGKRGRTFTLAMSVTLIRDDDGGPKARLIIMTDITERRQTEQRLQLQGAALQAAANAIVITDRAGTIEWVNPAFATHSGFTANEALGRNLRDLVKSGRHNAAFFQHLWTTILAGQVWQGEIINRRKDGSLYTEFQTITPVRDGRGEITHFIGIKEDITSRKAAEARIHEQAEIIDRAPVAIVITDLAHRVTYCNEGATRLYRLTAEQILHHTADELFTPETMRALGPGRAATLATGSWRGEVPIETPAGHRVTAEFIMSLIRDEAGQPIARLSIAVDITEKKQMGEQVKRMQRLENLGMLAAGIAHDMNNILAPIVMAVPLLKPRVSDARGQSILATMEKSGERGAALVRQLLSFAHGTSGEFKLIQVRHVLKDIAEMVAASFPKSLRLATDLPGALWPVTGSASQLHQVFLNLCINARDAMPDGGTLHLEAANRRLTAEEARAMPDARPGAFLAVTVNDTGTGIPPDTLARIWDPFFTTKAPDKGTGLGLSTVRGIVAQHQGFIALQTHVGQGTTFTVYLPADEAAVRGEDRPASATPLPRGDGELVLVVDDEPPVRELAAHILKHYGYRVLSAGDGAEALALFATHAQEVQLVVTDLQMPLLDGKNLVTALLRLRPGLPVICMSGADTVSKSLTPFLSAFLVKPFTLEALVETVHNALHRPAGNTAANP